MNEMFEIVSTPLQRGLLCLSLVILVLVAPALRAADDDYLNWLEMMNDLKVKALGVDKNISDQQLSGQMIKCFVKSLDKYSDYLSPEEYQKFRESQSATYSGIGIQLLQDEHGSVICFPYPGSPANKAGIQYGDVLVEAGGIKLEDISLTKLVPLIRKKTGESVQLKVLRKSELKSFRVECGTVERTSVISMELDSLPVIRILEFTNQTSREVTGVLEKLKHPELVVFDLRDNFGGDLFQAIDTADLFLGENLKICTVVKKSGAEDRISYNADKFTETKLVIWQNGYTASAAEIFTAALQENHRAITMGRKTFGKGISQDIIEISNGAALVVTTSQLLTPDGNDYHGVGIMPNVVLPAGKSDTTAYLDETKKVDFKNWASEKKSVETVTPIPPTDPENYTQIELTPLPSPSPTVTETGKTYYITPDRTFYTFSDTEIFYNLILSSVNFQGEILVHEEPSPEGTRYKLRMGNFPTRQSAQQEADRISGLMVGVGFGVGEVEK